MPSFFSAGELCKSSWPAPEECAFPMDDFHVARQLEALSGWTMLSGPTRLRKSWLVKDFVSGIEFFSSVCSVAESVGHHPDLHLVGFRHLSVEVWTHSVEGITLYDFILAARIDCLPIRLRVG